MLKIVDEALAGAIDVVADDIQATVKSVREQGVMRTIGDVVEDAAGMVTGASGAVLSNVGMKAVEQQRAGKQVSAHSGLSGSYADLCAKPTNTLPSQQSGGAGGAGGGVGTPKGDFAPGVGIQRASSSSSSVVTKPPMMDLLLCAGASAEGAAPTCAPANNSSPTSKEPPLDPSILETRFAELKTLDRANFTCFDCRRSNTEWVSVSFGVFLCVECCGQHRKMGTHISRIRSCKLDSWTDRQLQIFEHGGNTRLQEFFTANQVHSGAGFQRYSTPAAEWYRESWIKSRMFARAVPSPPSGILPGPCVASWRPPSKDEAERGTTARAGDLLEFAGEPGVGTTAVSPVAFATAPAADLLGFDTGPTTSSSLITAKTSPNADLLGTGQATTATDPFGLTSGMVPFPVTTDADLLSLAGNSAGLSHSSPLASLDFSESAEPRPVPAVRAEKIAAPSTPAGTLVSPSKEARTMISPISAANTLAGGAKLVDKLADLDKPVNDDPFAMALSRWNMS